MRQRWEDLLFAHWPVPPEALRPLIPHPLEIETWDGAAWLGIVPFRLAGLRFRRGPLVPRVHSFVELNVRTYVTNGERSGVWFLSLDASSRAAVLGARQTYRLPYHLARMATAERGGWIEFRHERVGGGFAFEARYRPVAEAAAASPGSLECFLAERYLLYAADRRGRLFSADIRHRPWPLQPAEAEIEVDGVGIELCGDPHLRFSRSIDVLIWPLRRTSLSA
jgi:uncharacterized protein YqjF (DUF2071 family)